MGRISRGFRLLGASWDVLRADKELLVLPVVSFACILGLAVPFGLGIFGLGLPEDGESFSVMQYVFMGVFYFATSFIAIFFNAAIVGAASIRLQGGDPTPRDGMRMAYEKIDKILGWALMTATVGLILRTIEQRAGWLGRIVISLIGAAWGAVTFFVVPVLLFEPEGVGSSVKRSASLFKARWGEQFVGNGSIGLAMFLIAIPLIIVVGFVASIAPVVGLVLGVLALGTLVTVGTAVSGIFNAALYRFAVTGAPGGAFTEDDLRGSFSERGRRGRGRTFGGGGFSGNGFSG